MASTKGPIDQLLLKLQARNCKYSRTKYPHSYNRAILFVCGYNIQIILFTAAHSKQSAGGGVSGSWRIAAAGRPYAPSAHRTPPPNIITNIVPGLQDRKHIPRLEPEPEVQTRPQIMNIIANIYFIGIGCFNLGSVKANGIIKIESHPENICKIHCKAG